MINLNERYSIFLDLDGTLLGPNRSAFYECVDTIQKVRALGHKVFLNTGRGTAFIPYEFKERSIVDGIISGAGALCTLDDEVIFGSLIPYDVVKKYAEYSLQNKLCSIIEGKYNMYYFEATKDAEEKLLKSIMNESWIKIDEDNLDTVLTPDVLVEKLTVLGNETGEIDKILGDKYIVLKMPHHTEIIQKNHCKSDAMLKIAKILGIPTSNIIAIGDSLNDYDMVNAAGIGIAMENACDELKAISDIICDTVDNAGASKVLKELFNL